jgi:hypothetical protein
MSKKTSKKPGRRPLPEHKFKKRRSLRLTDEQMDLVLRWGSLQEFVDHHIKDLERFNNTAKKFLKEDLRSGEA